MPGQEPPDAKRAVRYRVADLPNLRAEEVGKIKTEILRHLRATAKKPLSAERAGVTRQVLERWLEDDLAFREDADHAVQARADELELELESAAHLSRGDVTGRIFLLKGLRPETYMERIAQHNYQHAVYEPEFTLEEPTRDASEKASDRKPAPTH